MTQRHAPVRGREIIERWCALAERRLDHLTDLFESGRWRRFHTEAEFLDNIREARAAVETWRGLASQEASRNSPSWLDRSGGTPAYHGTVLHEEPRQRALQPEAIPALAVEPTPAAQIALAPLARVAADETVEPDTDWQQLLEPLVLLERYPILRNAM